jgi:hypothetical protein
LLTSVPPSWSVLSHLERTIAVERRERVDEHKHGDTFAGRHADRGG